MVDTIPFDVNVENVFEIFENIYKFYGKCLRHSLKKIVKSRRSKKPSYYNYLLFDGRKLEPLLEKYRQMEGVSWVFSPEDRKIFLEACFYVGKGKDGRKYKHLIEGKSRSKKFAKICEIWDSGFGVAVVQLHPEVNELEALSREFAIIKALGLENISNLINGTSYGLMEHAWNKNEIINFGNMMIYASMKNVLQDPPTFVYKDDL